MVEFDYRRKVTAGLLLGVATFEDKALKLVDEYEDNGKPANDESIAYKQISGVEVINDHVFISVVGRNDIQLQMVFDEDAQSFSKKLILKI